MVEIVSVIFPTLSAYVATCAVFLVAELIYVAFGFGAGLIAVGTLALVLPDVQNVVVLLLLVNIPVELVVVWNSRHLLRWQGLLLLLTGIAIGIILGTEVLLIGNPVILLSVLGIFLIVSGSGFAIAGGMVEWRIPRWTEPIIGLISGLLAGLFGTGGPPLIFYYQLKGTPKTLFRSHLMAIFLAMTVVRLPTYIFSNLITLPRLAAALAIAPAVITGALIGSRIHVRIAEETFRRLVGIALAIIGILLLIRHLA